MALIFQDIVSLGLFAVVAVAFVWVIVHFARKFHPFAAFRSLAPENSSLKFKKLRFAQIGGNQYFNYLSYAFRDDLVVFRCAWLLGFFPDYYVVPVNRLRATGNAKLDVVAHLDTGEVFLFIGEKFISTLSQDTKR